MSINFWLANDYTIFLSGNHTQSNASSTGKVWVGQTALYHNYDIGAALPVGRFTRSLEVLGDMNITGGINYSQNSAIDALGTVTKYTMSNLNGVTNQPIPFQYRPYDIYPYNFLQCSSIGWAQLTTGGIVKKEGSTLQLTGTSATLNHFPIDPLAIDISTITSVNIIVPPNATVLISIPGIAITLNNFTTLWNGVAITQAQAQYVVWNFPDADTISLQSDLYGVLLAPFSSINSGAVTIYGSLIAKNLAGQLNGIQNLFLGELPELYNPSTTGSCTTASTTTTTSTTSSTTTSTTTSTTSSTTTSSTTTTAPPRDQAINDLIESIALEQTALAHILNAEGEKIQKALSLGLPIAKLIEVNETVKELTNAITQLEIVLETKLETVECNICKRP
ncbi:MAG: choice-of-anchor A family protein [Lachnospiraceae bacterium]